MRVRWMAAAAVVAATLTAIPAQAGVIDLIFGRGRYDGRYRDYGYQRSRYARSAGFDRGYRDGLKHGRKDGDKGRSFYVARDNDFRDADNGYHREYGPRYEYSTGYRDGYQEGYRRGYAEYGRRYYGGYGNGRYHDDRYRNDRYRDDRYRDPRDGYYDRDGRFHPYDDYIYEVPRRY
jgi:peptidyl-prolyl cis-trans isomerase-like 4